MQFVTKLLARFKTTETPQPDAFDLRLNAMRGRRSDPTWQLFRNLRPHPEA
ncbi:hypothetical protein [Rhodobacter ferrooxidans]|uniref:Uncharacterized protein n=1 Tax=Rhodobacter ferrooxidans TaxID=371731 RepID=C8RYG3_9RHOB|nr:hypothetical protein [Rhodobacter sp. SW2]EEW26151.1 hypothetical protein Rsw2DRAFT_0841 [Rhodobacter sp. SW2]